MKAENLERFMSEDKAKIMRQLREWKSYANTEDMKEFVDDIIDELREGCHEHVWLPIESAPIDGARWILLGRPDYAIPEIGYFSKRHNVFVSGNGGVTIFGPNDPPTHWKPVPAPPKSLI
jgi:hypothetical protein